MENKNIMIDGRIKKLLKKVAEELIAFVKEANNISGYTDFNFEWEAERLFLRIADLIYDICDVPPKERDGYKI